MTVFIIYDIVIAYKTEKHIKWSQGQKESTDVYINKNIPYRHLSDSLTGVLKYQVYFT